VLFCVLCLTVAPLPPGTNPFEVKINNNKKYDGKQLDGRRSVQENNDGTEFSD
jgi:hypothetical protein